MLPGTIDGMKHVCYFRHALALDERRVKFLPEYAYGGYSKSQANSEQVQPETQLSDQGNKSRGGSGKVRPPIIRGLVCRDALRHVSQIFIILR